MNKEKMRGITLVSLVVTIIVLIILAGVSINLTLGENGIITMAKRARENMELAKVDEERQLNELYAQIVTEGGSSGNASDDAIIRLAQFKKEIASALTDMGIETAETADATTMSNNIRSLTGASSADKVSYDNTNSGLTSTNVQGAIDEIDNEINNLNESLNDSQIINRGRIDQVVSSSSSVHVTVNFDKPFTNTNYTVSFGNIFGEGFNYTFQGVREKNLNNMVLAVGNSGATSSKPFTVRLDWIAIGN